MRQRKLFALRSAAWRQYGVLRRDVRFYHKTQRRVAKAKEEGGGGGGGGKGGLLAWYSHKLDTHPVLTKAVSSCVIGGSGDVLSQYIEGGFQEFRWDPSRTARFGCLGLFLVGPVVHVWYGALMRWIPGTSAVAVSKRVALDQFAFSPVFLPTFLAGLWTLEGQNFGTTRKMLQEQVPSALVANWSLWTPAQVINFRFVPGKYQVLFSNFVGLVWNTYLSFTAHLASTKDR